MADKWWMKVKKFEGVSLHHNKITKKFEVWARVDGYKRLVGEFDTYDEAFNEVNMVGSVLKERTF